MSEQRRLPLSIAAQEARRPPSPALLLGADQERPRIPLTKDSNPSMAPKPKHPGGRPTDYRPEYGPQILDLMSAGLSLAAAAAEIGIHRQRVYDWVERYPEFEDVVKLAMVKRQLYLERRLLTAESGPVVTSSIFALKNAARADWRDTHDVEHSGMVTTMVDTEALRNLTEDQLEQLRSIAAAGMPPLLGHGGSAGGDEDA